MRRRPAITAAALAVVFVGASTPLHATIPPIDGGRFPDLMYSRMSEQPDSFAIKSGLLNFVKGLQQNKFDLLSAGLDFERPPKPYKLTGSMTIPIVMLQFSDSGQEPFAPADLQLKLFDAPSGSGTVGDYYREVSYGAFTVAGRVFGWKKLSKPQADYAGGTNCYGTCVNGKVSDMVLEALRASPEIDWSPFDHDHNGIVDFVAFAHPGRGAECRGNQNLWSHQSSLGATKAFVTSTPRPGGGFLTIQDYVIVPALSCKPETRMIEIGVFAHEFGHALGLPDLYSTDKSNPSVGAGAWCLMGTGSWGGDNKSPERPTHLSAWAKSFLGWIVPQVVTTPRIQVNIRSADKTATALSTSIDSSVYYLTERRDRAGSDANLPASGLLQWRIDEGIVSQGLQNNTVNNSATDPGIKLIEADGSDDLLTGQSRAAAGDMFGARPGAQTFDASTSPRSEGTFALCSVGPDGVTADIGLGGPCPFAPRPNAAPGARASAAGGRGAAPATQQTATTEKANAQALTVDALARSAAELMDRLVLVSGTIDNAGTNFFTDRRLVLRDADRQNAVPVELTGMVAEAVTASRAGEPPAPPQLSEVLGKRVEVTGRLQRLRLANGTSPIVFVVQTLRLR